MKYLDWGIALAVSLIAGLFLYQPFVSHQEITGLTVSMADPTLLTISLITKESMRVLRNSLTFARKVNRQYDKHFGVEGAKVGDVINARKPPRYVVKDGAALQLQDAKELSVPVTVDTQSHVAVQFTSKDMKLDLNSFSNTFIKPAVAAIANRVDHKGLQLYKDIPDFVGVPGVVPATALIYLSAGVALDDNSAPMDGERCAVITPLMQATLVDALKGLFHQSAAIASQYIKGTMGTALGFTFYMDQNCSTHTVGQLGGTPLVAGASQTGSSIATDGWTASAATRLKRGDVITFAGVNKVNRQSRESTGTLQPFVLTADGVSDGAGLMTVSIYPPITTSGAEQTVDASPANDAIILIFTHATSYASVATRQGLSFHRDAFTLVTADLPLYKGTDMAARAADEDLGMSIRLIRDYTIDNDSAPARLDVLFGWSTLRPELACRVLS